MDPICSHINIYVCVRSTRRSRWSFVLRNKKIKIWNTNGQNVIAWILKRHFKDFPNSISSPLWWKETQFCWQTWSHLREAFYHKDFSILNGIQKFSCKYFLFGEKEWPSLRTTLHVWSKGDILDLSSWEAQCTTAASYIFAKWRKSYVCLLEVHDWIAGGRSGWQWHINYWRGIFSCKPQFCFLSENGKKHMANQTKKQTAKNIANQTTKRKKLRKHGKQYKYMGNQTTENKANQTN